MNIFGFDYTEVAASHAFMLCSGVAFGFVMHLTRFILMHIMDRKGV